MAVAQRKGGAAAGGGGGTQKAAASPSSAAAAAAAAGARVPTRMQSLGVAAYIYFIPVCLLLNLLCLTTRYTALGWLLWVLWINVGPGKWAPKLATWPKRLRFLRWWRHCADYFPARLIRTAELDPNDRYIFVVAPHGVVTMFCWPCFDTDPCGFSKKFPGIDIHPMTLELNFRLPFMREFLLWHGVVDASRAACLMVLGKGPGQAILLAVGGAQESLLAAPGTMDLVLSKRKGFVRIALQTGAKLVPVIGFGENELYDTREVKRGSLRDSLQRLLKATLGFVLPNAVGRGFLGLMPHPKPLNVVVGAPVVFDGSKLLDKHQQQEQQHHQQQQQQQQQRQGGGDKDKQPQGQEKQQQQQQEQQAPPEPPSLDDFVDSYHAQYVEALRALWDAHKGEFAAGRRRSLDIVE